MLKYFSILLCCFPLISLGQEKYSEVDLDNHIYKEFEMLGDTLDQYKVYFTGENHTYTSFNTRFQVKFLKYLHQTQNVRHFIFEQSPAVGWLINEIIVNDQKEHKIYLKKMFFPPFYKMVLALENYNDTLALDDKIKMHGIDTERFPYFSLYAMGEITKSKNKNIQGGEVFEQIQALATSDFEDSPAEVFYADEDINLGFQFGDVNAHESLMSIIGTAMNNKDSISVELGKDSTIFYSIIRSLKNGEEWYNSEKRGDVKSPIIRERFMADQFALAYDPNSDEKYYGQFGRCHIHKDEDAGRCYDYYMNSIANRINDIDTSLKNQVLVIPIFYKNSKSFDGKVIKGLNFEEKFAEDGKTFIIDLAYKNGDHPIVGFYNQLPYMIVSNVEPDSFSSSGMSWDESYVDYHLGYYYGLYLVPKLRTLNTLIANAGSNTFSTSFVGHTIAFDTYQHGRAGGKYAFTWFPRVNNGDRFDLKGYNFTIGGYAPWGNEFVSGGFGLNFGYGKFKLIEETDNTVPNLLQSGGQNITIYENDVFIVDPALEFRLTLPLISLNVKGGYAFDLSGKHWRLDEKLTSYPRTSFSSPYIQFGASFHLKVRN